MSYVLYNTPPLRSYCMRYIYNCCKSLVKNMFGKGYAMVGSTSPPPPPPHTHTHTHTLLHRKKSKFSYCQEWRWTSPICHVYPLQCLEHTTLSRRQTCNLKYGLVAEAITMATDKHCISCSNLKHSLCCTHRHSVCTVRSSSLLYMVKNLHVEDY